MSMGAEPSMFFAGIVTVTKASLPTRCAWIVVTAAGMRTMGASGGPFLPQAATTKAAARTAHREGHEDVLETTKVTMFTKLRTNFTSCRSPLRAFAVQAVLARSAIRRPPAQP